MKESIRVANGAGFWGDQLDAPRRILEGAQVDYLTLEYLAELTLSILAYQKSKDPQSGYVTDFPLVMQDILPLWQKSPQTKIVTNAGGMNPHACAKAISLLLVKAGLGSKRIGIVTGDDVLQIREQLEIRAADFAEVKTDKTQPEILSGMVSANAYLGSEGIVAALRDGADIVITGRVADACLTVGPAIFEFGWKMDDWNRLAGASIAGHIIECGAQATGGMCSALDGRVDLSKVGYPIATIFADGSSVISKPDNTTGEVSIATVSEQIVYEIGDPRHYLTPDVDANFAEVRLKQLGVNQVHVTGASGTSRPPTLKVSTCFKDGFTASSTLVLIGPNAIANAKMSGELIRSRLESIGQLPEDFFVEVLGGGDSFPDASTTSSPASRSETTSPWEVVMRVSAYDKSREKIERFTREFAPLVTSGPAGVSGYTGGRAKSRPVFSYLPAFINRELAVAKVAVQSAEELANA